ncbi:glycosyltransferase family 4 protein [Nitrincola alkalilacustris]|uniref:glycosyltransferase family 4 protein n=1 Tax=Nitrincola alkalilacustris TaxID=1571224 RepID=UPI00124D1E6F|nr:glycosyltransferase family 4 protein [Nitrincola alkalilacustris]
MKILVTASHTPFLHGGADHQIHGLVQAFKDAGHQVELLRFPFRFSPETAISDLMRHCEGLDMNLPNGVQIDKVVSLQFPGYGVQHDDHRVWVMHQHRAVYDLFDAEQASPELKALKQEIEAYDLAAFSRATKLFAESHTVAKRLQTHNNLIAPPLYHPPYGESHFYHADPYPYIFYPSRLETLKRQSLLIQAARYMRSPVQILIGGVGGQQENYAREIEQAGVGDRVHLIGRFSDEEKYALYARSLAVFFGPYEEDYGYITLEAMLSGKPVITCTDSGGPLEFVKNGETGLICPPEPQAIAEAIDSLHSQRRYSTEMGHNARHHYRAMNIRWSHVVETLLQE